MKCNDQSISYLKSFGYNVVRLPKADIKPLQVLTKSRKSFELLGELSTVLNSGNNITYPFIKKDQMTSSISGKRTSDLSIGVGLTILGNVVSAMGGGKIGIEAQYSRARTITFEFRDVLTDDVEIAALDKYLTDADVNPFSTHIGQLLESDDIYIITSVIKSKSVNVVAATKDKASINVDVPVIQQIVGESIKVEASEQNAFDLSFIGPIPLVFGFKAIRLSYDGGRYTAFNPADDVTPMTALSNVESGNVDWMMPDSSLINLSTI